MSQFFTSVGQSTTSSAPTSVLPMNIQGWFTFRTNKFDLLAVQGTLKSLLQHHSSKAWVLQCSAFFTVQLSHPYMTTGKTIVLTRCESWNYKESWALKNWCFWTVVLEKTRESPLDCKEIQSVHPKGNQSCILFGRTDAEAETPTLQPSDVKSWLIGKDPDAGKDWRQEEKGTTEDKIVEWHHWLDGHRFGWTLEAGGGQGGLACCSPWITKIWTWLSGWTELSWLVKLSN